MRHHKKKRNTENVLNRGFFCYLNISSLKSSKTKQSKYDLRVAFLSLCHFSPSKSIFRHGKWAHTFRSFCIIFAFNLLVCVISASKICWLKLFVIRVEQYFKQKINMFVELHRWVHFMLWSFYCVNGWNWENEEEKKRKFISFLCQFSIFDTKQSSVILFYRNRIQAHHNLNFNSNFVIAKVTSNSSRG